MITTPTKPRSKATALHAIAEADVALNRVAQIPQKAATMTAKELMDTGLFCGQPGVRQLLPMLLELKQMAKHIRDNRPGWDSAYRDPEAVDSVLQDFKVASRALVRLIQASQHC